MIDFQVEPILMTSTPAASVDATLEISEGICVLTYDPLDVEHIRRLVLDEAAGSNLIFIGTTRNSFKGKVVTRLEYQAYSKLAIKTMADILRTTHRTLLDPNINEEYDKPSLIRSAIYHRLGNVPVGEPSIVIAVSSARRKLSFMGCELILEAVKGKAQIWKREFYDGEGDAEWKTNNL